MQTLPQLPDHQAPALPSIIDVVGSRLEVGDTIIGVVTALGYATFRPNRYRVKTRGFNTGDLVTEDKDGLIVKFRAVDTMLYRIER